MAWFLILPAVLLATLMVAPAPVHAESQGLTTLYGTSPNSQCRGDDGKLGEPYMHEGKFYYCIANVKSADTVPLSGGKCPANSIASPSYTVGTVCIRKNLTGAIFGVAPGCYVNSQGSIDKANCTDAASQQREQFGKCSLASGSSSGVSQFSEVPCSDTRLAEATTDSDDNALPTLETDCKKETVNQENCGIIRYLVIIINVLSALVGIVVVAMIIVGGIQYSAAGDNPQMISAAKKRIFNAILALVIYIFMFAFLQWLIPGGIFSSSNDTNSTTEAGE